MIKTLKYPMRYSDHKILVKVLLACICFLFSAMQCGAQFIKTSDLFQAQSSVQRGGRLNIFQDASIDTLLSRYILSKKLLGGGMEGFRIQIYRSSNRNAREESNKIRAQFMVDFPDIPSYIEYEKPGYFLVRVGNFRTRMEGTKTLYLIRRKYPDAYIVPCIISFSDLNKD
jgi:hypothetical protein